jgi:spore coat protein CotH
MEELTSLDEEKSKELKKQVNRVLDTTNGLIESQELLTMCLENLGSLEQRLGEFESYENSQTFKRTKVLIKTYTVNTSRQLEEIYGNLTRLKKALV